MAYGIDDYGNDLAPPGYMGPQEMPTTSNRDDAAKRFARQRLLFSIASGLSNPNQGGGFLGGLASGFSGSIQGGQQFQAKRHEEYRQQQKDEAEQRFPGGTGGLRRNPLSHVERLPRPDTDRRSSTRHLSNRSDTGA